MVLFVIGGYVAYEQILFSERVAEAKKIGLLLPTQSAYDIKSLNEALETFMSLRFRISTNTKNIAAKKGNSTAYLNNFRENIKLLKQIYQTPYSFGDMVGGYRMIALSLHGQLDKGTVFSESEKEFLKSELENAQKLVLKKMKMDIMDHANLCWYMMQRKPVLSPQIDFWVLNIIPGTVLPPRKPLKRNEKDFFLSRAIFLYQNCDTETEIKAVEKIAKGSNSYSGIYLRWMGEDILLKHEVQKEFKPILDRLNVCDS